MQIGPRQWHWVTTDTAGVPHGGKYGDVDWFEGELNANGLYLAWSRIWDTFGIYSHPNPARWIPQMLCIRKDNGEAIPLTYEFLLLILSCWEEAERCDYNVNAIVQQKVKDEKRRMMKDQYDRISEVMPDAVRAMRMRRGLITPRTTIEVPRMALQGMAGN